MSALRGKRVVKISVIWINDLGDEGAMIAGMLANDLWK